MGAGRAPLLEILSRGLLIGIGLWLMFRAIQARPVRGQSEGFSVALTTGLIPCPLTLFAVVAALSRGVPEAGLVFAMSMLVGIAVTLGLVAILAVAGRRTFLKLFSQKGRAISKVSRSLDAVAGLLIVLFASRDLLQ
ncbi:hypothetical protein LP7551_02221 [Roseibium album]|nr:hypothetical protein LP7551_02221 [Roseibium album]